jgi:hypothetical protein
MDPRERADAALARARARGAYVVTPEDAISPMDAASTQQIPRIVVSSLDERNSDLETTMVVQQPHPLVQSQPTQSQPSPRPRPHPQSYPPPQHHHQQQQQPGPPPEQEQQPEGMVPTVKPQPNRRPTMSQRLDGTL